MENMSPLAVILSRFSCLKGPVTHFTLPDDEDDELGYVFKQIALHASKCLQKYKLKPTLVIDSVDVLAKKSPEVFKDLIRLTKSCVNDGSLNIVLVGRFLPMLQKESEKLRSVVTEIGDVSLSEAKSLIENLGIDSNLSSKVVELTGGRLVLLHLAACINLVAIAQTMDDNYRYEEIKESLYYCVENDFIE